MEQRNQLMRNARERLSPGAAAVSRAAKDDAGRSVDELVERNVRKLLNEAGFTDKQVARLREAQTEDSDLWAKYKAALVGAEDAEAVYRSATRDLGGSPLVSRRIITSASRPNWRVSALAVLGAAGGAALGAKGVYDLTYEIVTAEEGERLVVATKGVSGFAGGIIGAEAGSAASAAWVASMALGPESILAVTLIGLAGSTAGGAVGGVLGQGLPGMAGMATSALAEAGLPSSLASTEGGLEGMVEREQAQHQPHPLSYRIEGAMIDLDHQIKDLEDKIHTAPDRGEMETFQKMRILALRKRAKLDEVLSEVVAMEKKHQ